MLYAAIAIVIILITSISGAHYLSTSTDITTSTPTPTTLTPTPTPTTSTSTPTRLTFNGIQIEIVSVNKPEFYDTGTISFSPQSDDYTFIFVNATLSQDSSYAKDWNVSLKDENGTIFGIAISPPIMTIEDSINYVSWVFQVLKTSNSLEFILPDQQTIDLNPFL
jgi:hypothetical protein